MIGVVEAGRLQDNQLTSATQLRPLTALQKLDLDGNCIEAVSGLEKMQFLKVLHISRQRLCAGKGVRFDAASIQGLSGSLATLRASSCGIKNIAGVCLPSPGPVVHIICCISE